MMRFLIRAKIPTEAGNKTLPDPHFLKNLESNIIMIVSVDPCMMKEYLLLGFLTTMVEVLSVFWKKSRIKHKDFFNMKY
jgi:hypothetical protein